MEKANYKAWGIRIADFPLSGTLEDRLSFILGYGILAPSAHNSQPWEFSIEKNTINVYAAFSRRLSVSDFTDRELYISVGCCIANIQIALEEFGVEYSYEKFPQQEDSKLVAKIVVGSDSFNYEKAKQSERLKAIISRHSNRNPHESISESDIDRINGYSGNFSSEKHALLITSDDNVKRELSAVASKAMEEAMQNKEFREELSEWVRNNYTSSGLGMPGFLMGVPGPVSLVLPKLIKAASPGKGTFKKEEKLFSEDSNAVGVLVTETDDKIHWVEGGVKFERFLIDATVDGFSIAFYAAPIEIGEYHKDFQRILNTGKRPLVFFRIGRAKKDAKTSPRLNVEECLA